MNSAKHILITGGAGYIGSHTSLVMALAGYDVSILDNFSNSSEKAFSHLETLAGKKLRLWKGDVCDRKFLDEVFSSTNYFAVMHFAGLKSVGESMAQPIEYFTNNVLGTVSLCSAMRDANVSRLIFSSSATVYGWQELMPLKEDGVLGKVTNPYGRTKLVAEQFLTDLASSDLNWKIALLRYFNPVGAHPSGMIGEDPRGVPNNLWPYISQVATGVLDKLLIFGSDYPTKDGTGMRDYIHVMDVAEGHLAALLALERFNGANVWNLGTGQSYSVLEIVKSFEKASGLTVPYELVGRRTGDLAECWADVSKAKRDLQWEAARGVEEMVRDGWRWQKNFPRGY